MLGREARAPAPVSLSCSNTPAAQGTGRWTSDREWVFDFTNELPAATVCTFQVRPGLQSLQGTAFKGRSRYTFKTGGLRVLSVQPGENTAIDEEQFFILQLNGPATLASVQASVGCQIEGLGERVAVRLIEGEARAALLKSRGTRLAQAATQAPLNWATLACNRESLIGAMLNLIENALQAAGPQARLLISAQLLGDGLLRLSVLDNGPGIPAPLLEQIKEPFFTTRPQGTGLGLSVAQVVAKAHKGQFFIESASAPAAETGTRAGFVLPCQCDAAIEFNPNAVA